MDNFSLNFYKDDGTLVFHKTVSRAFLQQFPEIRMFYSCLTGSFKENTNRSINIYHPKLTKDIVRAYMNHLIYRLLRRLNIMDPADPGYIELLTQIINRKPEAPLDVIVADLNRKMSADPANGASIYIAALAEYLGDEIFEVGYYPGDIIGLTPFLKIQDEDSDEEATRFYLYYYQKPRKPVQEIELDSMSIRLTPGYRTRSEIMIELMDQLPEGLLIKIREGEIYLAIAANSDRRYEVGARTFVKRAVQMKVNGYDSTELRLDFEPQMPILANDVADDFPNHLTEWSATAVAENYIDRIVSDPVGTDRKLYNFCTKKSIIAKVVWESDKRSLLELLDIPKYSFNRLLKFSFSELTDHAEQHSNDNDRTNQFYDPDLEKLSDKLKILREKFFSSNLWREYKKIIRHCDDVARARIKDFERNDRDNSPLWIWDEIKTFEGRWQTRYDQLKQKQPKQSARPPWAKKQSAVVL